MPQGPDGKSLADELQRTRSHITNSVVWSEWAEGPDDDDQAEWNYEPTPPKSSFEMTVYMHMLGRGQPTPDTPADDAE